MVGDGVLVGLLAPGADWVLFLVKPVVLHAVCCLYHRRSFRGYHFCRFCLCNPCPGTEDWIAMIVTNGSHEIVPFKVQRYSAYTPKPRDYGAALGIRV